MARLGNGWLAEVVKLMVAVYVGYLIRTIWSSSVFDDAAYIPPDILNNLELLKEQLHERYQPQNMQDVISYEYLNSEYMLTNMGPYPKMTLAGHQKSNLVGIVHQAMRQFNSLQNNTWKTNNLLNGHRRIDPLRGEEYILDMEIFQPGTTQSHTHRFTLVRPFTMPLLLHDELLSGDKMIHFIVTASDLVAERFEMFLRNFEEVCIKNNENVYLLIILFQKEDGTEGSHAGVIKKLVDLIQKKYQHIPIHLIQTSKEFNRGFGLDLALKQLPPSSLAFICDTDVTFTRDFLNRCRHNTIMNKQVYYPMVFNQYNPSIVKDFSPKGTSMGLMDFNEYTGYWIDYGYGMVCMYVGDYHVTGGFNKNRHGWGGEDLDLYNKHVKQKINIFRLPDPGLVHRYHDRYCSPKLSKNQYRSCVNSAADKYASKSQLAKKLTAMGVKVYQ